MARNIDVTLTSIGPDGVAAESNGNWPESIDFANVSHFAVAIIFARTHRSRAVACKQRANHSFAIRQATCKDLVVLVGGHTGI
jgi:hypothetical protein